MKNEALPFPETGVQITGIARIAERIGVFLLLLIALVIIVTWLAFAAHAENNVLEIKTQAIKSQTLRLRDYNISLMEQVYEVCLTAEAPGFFRHYDWEVLARGP